MSNPPGPRRVPPPLVYLGLLSVLLGACSKPAEEADIKPTAQVQWEAAAARSLQDAVLAYGVVEADAGQGEVLSAQVESQVAEVYARNGELVHRGQKLLRLRPSPATALEAGRAQRDALAAHVEWQRVLRLREQGLATDSELQAARAASESADALHASLAARVGTGGGLTVAAPAEGIVDALAARAGDVVAPGAVIARIEQANSRLVRAGVEADALPGVAIGQAVGLVDLGGAALGDGRVLSVDHRLDPQTGLATVLVHADGVPLATGTRVRARIIRSTHAGAVAVPRSAVLYEGEEAYLYVAAGGKAERRVVQVGLRDGDAVEVVEGLKAGEHVVTVGNDELSDAMAIQVAPDAEKAGKADKADPP